MNQSSGQFSFLPLHFLQTIPPSLPNFLLFLWLILGRFPPCCWQKMTKIWCIFPGESSWADSTYSPCCLKRGMVQQNSTALPLRVNPKLRDASLLLCFMLYRLKCPSGFLVSCGDETILSTSLQHADKALTIRCWLAQFHFSCVMLVSHVLLASHPMWNQSPCLFCRTGFCVYLQRAVVWPAGKNDLGSQDRARSKNMCPFLQGI